MPSPLTWFDHLPSTQDEAHRLAATGAVPGTAVAARIQTAGRGTRGRAWVSGAGGLWLSVVCRPEQGESTAVEVVGLRVGLALADYLDTLLPPPSSLTLKWPNDLMLGEGKLGGVLAEARWQGDRLGWIVMGIGLNLHNELPTGTERRAVRLLDAGVSATARALAAPVTAVVANAARTAVPLTEAEIAAFHARDWLRDRELRLPRVGTACGIGPTGRLRVRRGDGIVVEVDGTVELSKSP
ncbi:MAG TPA: biotin--[acetyl-CoA-carboxylase] ligase [Gemmatimonadales bacterium]|nr:biotin--[acetyl-CoA-carboxylase] ligase [Gemmatimonadales bacterium]